MHHCSLYTLELAIRHTVSKASHCLSLIQLGSNLQAVLTRAAVYFPTNLTHSYCKTIWCNDQWSFPQMSWDFYTKMYFFSSILFCWHKCCSYFAHRVNCLTVLHMKYGNKCQEINVYVSVRCLCSPLLLVYDYKGYKWPKVMKFSMANWLLHATKIDLPIMRPE